VISICVTCLEVLLRFAILHSKGRAVDVGSIKRSTIAGPSLLFGRAVVWAGGKMHNTVAG
jgi:hypothetical protein